MAAYAGAMDPTDWPQNGTRETMRRFAANARRTEDTIISDYNCDRATVRWLATAWAKRAGLVPLSLNRTDRHDRTIPFWVADIIWVLREGPQ